MAVPAAARPTLLAPSAANNIARSLSLRRVAKAAQGLTHSRRDTLSCNLYANSRDEEDSTTTNRSYRALQLCTARFAGYVTTLLDGATCGTLHLLASILSHKAFTKPTTTATRRSASLFFSRCHPRVGIRFAQGCSAVPLTSCARSSGDLSVRWVAPITHGPGDALLQQHCSTTLMRSNLRFTSLMQSTPLLLQLTAFRSAWSQSRHTPASGGSAE